MEEGVNIEYISEEREIKKMGWTLRVGTWNINNFGNGMAVKDMGRGWRHMFLESRDPYIPPHKRRNTRSRPRSEQGRGRRYEHHREHPETQRIQHVADCILASKVAVLNICELTSTGIRNNTMGVLVQALGSVWQYRIDKPTGPHNLALLWDTSKVTLDSFDPLRSLRWFERIYMAKFQTNGVSFTVLGVHLKADRPPARYDYIRKEQVKDIVQELGKKERTICFGDFNNDIPNVKKQCIQKNWFVYKGDGVCEETMKPLNDHMRHDTNTHVTHDGGSRLDHIWTSKDLRATVPSDITCGPGPLSLRPYDGVSDHYLLVADVTENAPNAARVDAPPPDAFSLRI